MNILVLYANREIYAIGMNLLDESAVYEYKIEQDMWIVKNLQQCFLGMKLLYTVVFRFKPVCTIFLA